MGHYKWISNSFSSSQNLTSTSAVGVSLTCGEEPSSCPPPPQMNCPSPPPPQMSCLSPPPPQMRCPAPPPPREFQEPLNSTEFVLQSTRQRLESAELCSFSQIVSPVAARTHSLGKLRYITRYILTLFLRCDHSTHNLVW